MFVDSHAHLIDVRYGGEIDSVVEKYRAANVGYVVNSGYDLQSSVESARLAEKYDDMFFTAGVHPEEAYGFTCETLAELKTLSQNKKCVGIGETGFDFHRKSLPSTEEEQLFAFEKQLELANVMNLPLVIHSRDAAEKTFEFLKERIELLKNGFLLHCFSESAEMAERYVELGAHFSFGGVLTFKNAKKDDVIKAIPIERILTETDCPYLTPEPFRGELNDPSKIPYIVAKIAEIKSQTVEEVTQKVEINFKRFYRI